MSMVRYNDSTGSARASPSSQGPPQEYTVHDDEGNPHVACYPLISDTCEITEFKATDGTWGNSANARSVCVAPTIGGNFGVVATNRNCCMKNATLSGCTFGDTCRFFHAEPGSIMTNLPKRHPKFMGEIDITCGTSQKLSFLTNWRKENVMTIEDSNEAYLAKLEVQVAKRQADKSKRKAQDDRGAQLKAMLGGAAESGVKKQRFARPRPNLQMSDADTEPGSPITSAASVHYDPPPLDTDQQVFQFRQSIAREDLVNVSPMPSAPEPVIAVLSPAPDETIVSADAE
jgi:hypothetical protein